MENALKQKSAVVIEDDPDQAALLKLRLEGLKMFRDIYIFHNGQDALSYLKNTKNNNMALPGLVILDLNLPDGSGFNVLDTMKQNPAWQRIPVIVHTASDEKSDMVKAYRSGSIFFMKKSSDKEVLNEAITEIKISGLL